MHELLASIGDGLGSIAGQIGALLAPILYPLGTAIAWLQTRNGSLFAIALIIFIVALFRRYARRR